MRIIDVNDDCLLQIFLFCNEQDLRNLCCTHRLFRRIIEENIYYIKTLDLLICGHRNSPNIGNRTLTPLSYQDRLTINRNWVKGCYKEYSYYNHAQMFPATIHLEKQSLYMTFTRYLRQFNRLDNENVLSRSSEPLQHRYNKEIKSSVMSDIADFVKKDDTIFAGHVCGNCFIYEDGQITEQRLHSPKEYLYCVNFMDNMYATGTDTSTKLWRRSDEFNLKYFDLIMEIDHSSKCLDFNVSGDRMYCGLYTDRNRQALREIHIDSGLEDTLNSDTISIYDLKVKDDNILFTVHFDTTFRMYDRRSNKDEAIWEDIFDSSFYCLDYDGLYAVLCGTKYHSRVNLYDIRMPGKYIQLYFPNRRRTSSPVHSVAGDCRYLFIATDHNLSVMDFKNEYSSCHDYSDLFNDIL